MRHFKVKALLLFLLSTFLVLNQYYITNPVYLIYCMLDKSYYNYYIGIIFLSKLTELSYSNKTIYSNYQIDIW